MNAKRMNGLFLAAMAAGAVLMLSTAARADDWWSVSCPSGYSLKKAGARMRCESVVEAASRERPRCASGYEMEVRDGRDTCVKPGRDDARARTSCASGWRIELDAIADQDQCAKDKSSGAQKFKDPSCPAGYDYKPLDGRDECLKPGTDDKVKAYTCDAGSVSVIDEDDDADRCIKDAQIKIKAPQVEKQK